MLVLSIDDPPLISLWANQHGFGIRIRILTRLLVDSLMSLLPVCPNSLLAQLAKQGV